MTTLYCIKHEQMAHTQNGNPAEFVHETWMEMDCGCPEYDVCEFPYGWAVCPPPESLFESILAADDDEVWEKWCMENEPGTDDLDNLVLESVF